MHEMICLDKVSAVVYNMISGDVRKIFLRSQLFEK